MDYKVSISENNLFVLVKLHTDVTKEIALSYTKEAIKVGKENGLSRIFIDLRGFDSKSGVLGKYEFAYKSKEDLGMTPDCKVALLRDEDKEHMQFFETVMQNAGYNYRMFTVKGTALAWLVE